MPGVLLKSGVRRTAIVSLSAAGATGMSYLYSAPDTKEAWQVRLLLNCSARSGTARKGTLTGPTHLQGAVVHAARRAAQLGEAGTALFRSLSAALSWPTQDSSRQSMLPTGLYLNDEP